jgi:hypothetical protein
MPPASADPGVKFVQSTVMRSLLSFELGDC